MTRASDTARLIGAGATINDGTTITTADNTTQLTLKSTDADGSSGPLLDLTRDSGSPADGDVTGIIRFRADNDAGEVTTTGQIVSLLNDASDGTEDGEIKIETTIAGSAQPRIDILPSETVFNEGSVDVDFRVESNGNANALIVDGEHSTVGINTAAVSNRTLKIEGEGDLGAGISLNESTRGGYVEFKAGTASELYVGSELAILGSGSNQELLIHTGVAALKIDRSGNLLIGANSAVPSGSVGGSAFEPAADNRNILSLGCTTTSSRNVATFRNPNNLVGTINVSGTTTGFNTSSDYRLKENVVTDWDATSRLKQLKPSRFNFKADKDTTVDGFLAHEVQSIVPVAINGEKDAVDKDGNPEYQGIDQSKLVPILTKSLQEALARIDTLEAEVAKLKG